MLKAPTLDYASTLAFLYALEPRGVRLGLDRMRDALERVGSPHKQLRVVHVAGTNGKGSVSSLLASVARHAGPTGCKVGLYTSPHLHRFVERIQIQGVPIDEHEVVERVHFVRTHHRELSETLTFFEFATLIAFMSFVDHGCDLVVVETGLGGRLDATNVVTPVLSIITEIALDHTDRLGSTLAEVAFEKAGIIKPHVPVIVGATDPDARCVIEARAAQQQSTVFAYGREFGVREYRSRKSDCFASDCVHDASGDLYVGQKRDWPAVTMPLCGAHQARNVASVLQAVAVLNAMGFTWPEHVVIDAVEHATWPARFEVVDKNPTAIVDAAHNPQGAQALAETLTAWKRDHVFPGPSVLVFAAMSDKDHASMLAALVPMFDHVIFPALALRRAMSPSLLATEISGSHVCASVAIAMAEAKAIATSTGLVVVAGSIFLVAEARAHCLGIQTEPPIPL